MSTYASQQDVANYIEGWVTDDAFALERLLQRCERELDPILVPVNIELPPTQVINLPGATGGNLTLSITIAGITYTTTSLAYPLSAASIQAALAALTPIGVDSNGISNARVLGNNPWTVVWTKQWVQTNFNGLPPPAVNWQVPLLTVNTSGIVPAGTNATVIQVPGRKINPLTDLDENQVAGLSNAVCAQVEYRNAMGERFFIRPQYSSVRGPDFTTQGRLPMISPKARRELSQNGLIMTAGRAAVAWGRRGVARGWPTY